MNMKKGQAAMEFLMTYGWAILVVLAAIGALAYFGVLSPDKFLPDKCTAAPPFSCAQYKVSGGAGPGNINVTLNNNAGSDMSTVAVGLTCGDKSTAAVFDAVTGNGTGVLNGNSATYSFHCAAGAPVSGQKFSSNFTITYITTGQSVAHSSTGVLQVRSE